MFPNCSQHSTILQSDLLALCELTPPSPVLSPTQLDASWSWSDIQIELDFSIDGTQDIQNSSHNIGRNSGLGILTSSSISTVGSAGTFGPTSKRHKTPGAFNPSNSRRSTNSGLSTLEEVNFASRSGSSENVSLSTPASPHLRSPNRSSMTSDFSSDQVCAIASDRMSLSLSRSNNLTISPGVSSRSCNKDNTIDNEDVLRTRMLSIITDTSPLGSSHDCLLLSSSDSCPMSVRPKSHQAILLTSDSDDASVHARTRRLAVAATLAALEKKCHSEPSTPECVSKPRHGLPSNFSAASVEIMIDQEGFRGVLARFKYSGYTQAISGHPSDKDENGVVHFKPVKRQAFYFHYAALESLPVLRRITVNGEESRDYISRQASLCMKTNGVYFVKGNETLSFPAPGEATPMSKLQWRFEYMVDDRRSDASRKVISDGEKLLTPLSFSCSPLLLHPLQGKRVRLMHVMKKTVIPKLVAEKMEPPSFSLIVKPQVDQVQKAPPSPIPLCTGIRIRGFQSHKRSATLWIPGDEIGITRPSIDLVTSCQHKLSPHRRRRASSAGEHSLPEKSLLPPARHLAYGLSSPLCQNIIPRSHLATMIDVESIPTENIPTSSLESSIIDEPFYPLSPSPHSHLSRTNVVIRS